MFGVRKKAWRAGWRSDAAKTNGSGCRQAHGAVEKSSFYRVVVQPLEAIVESVCPIRVRKVRLGDKLESTPRPSVGDMRERIDAIRRIPAASASPQDAHHLLLLAKRILHEAKERGIQDPQLRTLKAVAANTHSLFCRRRGVSHGQAAICNDSIRQRAVKELTGGLADALVIIVSQPKGSGLKVVHVNGGGGDGDPPKRGPGRGGLIIRTGIANCPYKFYPDHETIEFCPYRDEEGQKYLFRRTQKEAVDIVNRLTGGMKSGKDDWYVDFTDRDANVLRSANDGFFNDCVEREECAASERKGNRHWTNYARLRRKPKSAQK